MKGIDVRGARGVLLAAISVLSLVAAILLLRSPGTQDVLSDPGLVSWPIAAPESEGFDAVALAALASDLQRRTTKALLVARHGRIVFEWYASDFSPVRTHYTAAMAKGTAAAPALLAAAGRGIISLDDRVSEWIPEWADATHSDIRLRDLASHSSGLENIEFRAAEDGQLHGWRQYYYDHPEARYRLAIDSAKTLFPPGTDFGYSGIGYYVLSYVVTRALARGPGHDLSSFLAEKVYEPLGIPAEAWSIGYDRVDEVDGLSLTHLGSGGRITARAAARVGQLFLQRGCWEGEQLLAADLVDASLGRDRLVPARSTEPEANEPEAGFGWWVNTNRAWPFAAETAAAAIGAGHQVTWIDPELDLVVVRLGWDLSGEREPFYHALSRYVLEPIYAAIISVPTTADTDSECPIQGFPPGVRRAGTSD